MPILTGNLSRSFREFLLIAGLLCQGAIFSQAQTVTPGVIFQSYLAEPPDGGPARQAYFIGTPPIVSNGYDGIGIYLNLANRLVWDEGNSTIGNAMTFYVSVLGDKIDPGYISTRTRFADNWGYASGYAYAAGPIIAVGQSVYLSYWRNANSNGSYDFSSLPSSAIGPGDQIGWAKVTRNAAGLSLAASAMDYSGNGIVVGSFSSIPEPSVYAALLGAVTFGFVAIRRGTRSTGAVLTLDKRPGAAA